MTTLLPTTSTSTALHLAQRLIQVGIALSAERNLEQLLQLIVSEAQNLTNAEGVSLYLRQDNTLYFKIVQNHVITPSAPTQALPLNDTTHPSIAAYVVQTGKSLNIADVYQIPTDAPYQFNPDFDRQTGYRTTSMLTVPMQELDGQILGALQLINHHDRPQQSPSLFPELETSVAESLASQATIAYKNILLEEKLRASYRDTIQRLSAVAEYRDPETGAHIVRMSHYSRIIAKHMGLPQDYQTLIFDASPMHDLGKVGIPDAILLKPGKFTPEERTIMMQHAQIGADILGNSEAELLQLSKAIAQSHHEKYDGTGYPLGLKGEDIPLAGRIVALADVYDALSSKRVYKNAWEQEEVLDRIQQDTGSHFDPQVVAAFFAGLSEILEIQARYR